MTRYACFVCLFVYLANGIYIYIYICIYIYIYIYIYKFCVSIFPKYSARYVKVEPNIYFENRKKLHFYPDKPVS